MTLKAQVLQVLKEYPQARDSDQWLTLMLWTKFYASRIHKEEDVGEVKGRKFVYLKDILALPREDHIKRIRADIQNVQKLYPPTTIEVVKARRQNEEKWREKMHRDTL